MTRYPKLIGAVILAVVLLLGVSVFALFVAPPDRSIDILAAVILVAISAGFTIYFLRFRMGQTDSVPARDDVIENQSSPVGQVDVGRSRGGPKPTPPEKQQEIIEGWLKAQQEGESQEAYCSRVGVGSSTLRAWMRKMDKDSS